MDYGYRWWQHLPDKAPDLHDTTGPLLANIGCWCEFDQLENPTSTRAFITKACGAEVLIRGGYIDIGFDRLHVVGATFTLAVPWRTRLLRPLHRYFPVDWVRAPTSESAPRDARRR